MRAFLHDELLESLPADYDRDRLLEARQVTYVIQQDVTYSYAAPVRDLRQRLVVLPKRHHLDQERIADRLRVRHAQPASIDRRSDRFRNTVVRVHVPDVSERVEFQVRAVVERTVDPTPSARSWTCLPTPLTQPDRALREAANELRRGDVTDTVLAMSSLVRKSFEYCHDVTTVRTSAAEAWAERRGVCQDMAHVMLAMCASLEIPARYVSGHLVGDGASHAWVEVFDERRQHVVSIDPTHDRQTDLRYITTATGRDYRDVAPTSGTFVSAGGRGTMHVRKSVRIALLR